MGLSMRTHVLGGLGFGDYAPARRGNRGSPADATAGSSACRYPRRIKLAGLSSPPGEDDVVQGTEPPNEAGLLPGRQCDLVFHGAGPAADRGATRVVQERGHSRVAGGDEGGEAADARGAGAV